MSTQITWKTWQPRADNLLLGAFPGYNRILCLDEPLNWETATAQDIEDLRMADLVLVLHSGGFCDIVKNRYGDHVNGVFWASGRPVPSEIRRFAPVV